MKYTFTNKSTSRLYTIFILFFLLTIILLISSCDTIRPYLSAKELPLQTAEKNGIAVECLYLNYNDIENKHGWKANPFLPPDLGFTPKQMIVFDLKITNKENAPVILNSKYVSLHYGDKTYSPMSKVDMDMKIEEWATDRAYILPENRIAKQYMLPAIATINEGKTVTGYYVFMGGFAGKNMPTELVLSFTTPAGKEAADITFAYTLTLNKK